jgi:carboxymethylenebutenolidase
MRSSLPSGRAVELAVPSDGRPPTQGLVLLPDIMDLRPLFDAHSQRLADEHGWAVANVEIWHGHPAVDLEARLAAVGELDDAALLADLVAAADLLEVDPVGVAGFCMGGMLALKAAGTGRFHRAVAFYGMIRVPPHWMGPSTLQPLDQLAKPGACPALAIVGGIDQWTPPDDVAAAEAAGVTIARYPQADHGFVHDDTRPTHRADDAADAWSRAIAFLRPETPPAGG